MPTTKHPRAEVQNPYSGPIATIDDICHRFHLHPLAPQIRALQAATASDGVVDVAVVGRFKAGKSSFLNDLIGRPVLPVDVLPATAVVTRIAPGPEDRVTVRYLSGQAEETDLVRVPEFVTEEANPANAKQVALVDIELEGLETFAGLRFVDTPGAGSLFAHNTRTLLDWLPETGAALVAMSVDSPLAEDDLTLLTEIGRFTPEVAVLLTKIDLAGDALHRVLAFVCDQITHYLGRPIPILTFSVRPDFAAHRRAVREHLTVHIARHRHERSRAIIAHKLQTLVQESRSYLEVALSAADASENARARVRDLLAAERRDLDQVRREIALLAADLEARVDHTAHERFRSLHPTVLAGLQAGFAAQAPRWRGHLGRVTVAYREWLERAVREELSALSPEGRRFVTGELEEACAAFSRVVRAFQDRLAHDVEQALGISFAGADFQPMVSAPTDPDIRVGRPFETPWELLWVVIPMPVFRPLVLRHFQRDLPWEVEKNLSRLAGQWSTAAAHSIQAVAAQARSFLEEELATLEELAARPDTRRHEVTEALQRLESIAASADPHTSAPFPPPQPRPDPAAG